MTDRWTRNMPPDTDRSKGKRLGTLWADMDTGEGDVTLNILIDEDPLLRADVLKDWIFLLEREYELAVEQMFDGIDEMNKVVVFPGRKK